jgi:hypothetical protein
MEARQFQAQDIDAADPEFDIRVSVLWSFTEGMSTC